MKNEIKITKKLMMSWAKKPIFISPASVFRFALVCFCGLLSVLLLFVTVFLNLDWIYCYLSALLVVYYVYRIFILRFAIASKRYKILSKTYGVSEWILSFEFLENEIVASEHTSSITKYSYANIIKIKDLGADAIIVFDSKLGLRINKDSFTEGTWDECLELIESKMKMK